MGLPFTLEQFFDVFGRYNESTWIVMILFYILSIVSIYFMIERKEITSNFNLALLATLWIWMGIVYHIVFFSSINKAALIFGASFIIEGGLISLAFRKKLEFEIKKDFVSYTGLFFILFGLFIYPMIGFLSGHTFPRAPLFGAPCPTTIFTFGIFLLVKNRFPKHLLIIPVIWAAIGTFAAINLNVIQDHMLPISALITSGMIIFRKKE